MLKLSAYTDLRGSDLFSRWPCSCGASDPDDVKIPTDSSGFGELSSNSACPFSRTRWCSRFGEVKKKKWVHREHKVEQAAHRDGL